MILQVSSSPTPSSNTGSPSPVPVSGIAAHLDYLVVCGDGIASDICRAVWSAFGTVWDFESAKSGTRGRFYDTILMSPQGIELAYAIPNEATGLSRYRLSIPGKPLCHIPTKQLDDFGKWLVNSGCRCSRLDWAIDDYSHGLRLEDIEEAVREGSYSGARVCRIYEKRVRGGTQIGKTIYLGSSESDRQVRIYDKAVESKGLIDAIRYEVQWRDELAHKCFMALFSSDSFEDGSKLVSQYAVGSVHFVSRVDKNLPRCPVKPWWQEFIDKVGERLKLSVPRVQPMLSDKKRWIERQVAATIAVIVRCMGFDDAFHWLEREVREKLAHQSGRADSFVRTWHDRQEVERLGFEDAWVMDSWNVA